MLKKYIKPGILASLVALPLAGVAEDTINVRILDRDTESGGITWLVKSVDNRDIETVQY